MNLKHRYYLIILFVFFVTSVNGQVKADWASIDQRPFPAWWKEAKFGIFIHWGPYAVPAFARVGDYSEWYWKNLNAETPNGKLTNEFHKSNFGEDFTYSDFFPLFRAELFEPEQWADLFKRSGARYVVLTSKHHDGFTLWPNEQASTTWGNPWNSASIGPRRDLLGDLTMAVRAKGLKMGYYFSLYEWFNPLYLEDVDRYVNQHMIPQFKELVTNYEPSVIFSDGEWEHPASTWRSEEIIAWLYNSAPNKDELVINDRWGKSTRHRHGGYYTTEYGSGLSDINVPWEENRGMGLSYGFNRLENFEDYKTSREFIYMLIDIVSRGGNFLLNIGPTSDGRIPVVMQQRLIEIGQWLDINGEAIYGTLPWQIPQQWSAGEIRDQERGEYKSGYDILKLTVNPDPGYAVKEIMFTRKGSTLYAICPIYPAGELIINDVKLKVDARVSHLGSEEKLIWEQRGEDLVVQVPSITPEIGPGSYAYVFRIEGLNE